MPKVHLNRTGGARRGMTYVGISQRSISDDRERREKRALRQKKNIVRDAKLLARSEDWRAAGEQFAVLFRRWKAAGSAGRAHDDKLWKTFKAAADQFHERRAKHFAELDRIAKAKATAKQKLIAEAEKLELDQRLRDRQRSALRHHGPLARDRARRASRERAVDPVRQCQAGDVQRNRRGPPRPPERVRATRRRADRRAPRDDRQAQGTAPGSSACGEGDSCRVGSDWKWPKNSTHEPQRSMDTSKNVNAGSRRTPSGWLARWSAKTR